MMGRVLLEYRFHTKVRPNGRTIVEHEITEAMGGIPNTLDDLIMFNARPKAGLCYSFMPQNHSIVTKTAAMNRKNFVHYNHNRMPDVSLLVRHRTHVDLVF